MKDIYLTMYVYIYEDTFGIGNRLFCIKLQSSNDSIS